MSATSHQNDANAVANQPGEVGSHVKPTPQYQKGHQPGQLVGNDALPESKIETLPPGTAPADKTFTPNPQGTVPSQAANPSATSTTSASATLGGATSGDVNAGLGKPIQGQSSAELRHDGQAHRQHQAGGLQGVGASGAGHFDQASSGNRVPVEQQFAREKDTVRE